MAKSRKKTRRQEHESFIFRLGAPSASYSFSTQLRPEDADAFWESQMVQVTAECLHPDRFKGREATVHLLGGRDEMDMETRRRGTRKPLSVGWMEAGKSRFEVTVGLPLDACWAIGAALAAGSITHMVTHGPSPFRGRATVTSISFEGHAFDLTDYTG